MATKKKGGLFAKLTQMPERSEDYARKTLPTNRWALGWDIFRTNFGKIFKINLLMLLFIFPIFLIWAGNGFLVEVQAMSAPFSQNLGIGYPTYPAISGIAERLVYETNVLTFVLVFVFSFMASVGISGGFYVMRNMVWTEGVFVMSDFWSGVKKNYKNAMLSSLLLTVVLALTVLSINLADIQIALYPDQAVIFTITKIISYIFIAVFIIIYLYMLTLGVTYKLKFFKLLKNATILCVALLPYNVFFALFAIVVFLPLLAEVGNIFFTIGLIILILFALSVFALIWTNYSQWVFDEFINDKVAGAKKNRGIYKENDVKETYTYTGKSVLSKRPIKPVTDYEIEIVAIPEHFSRADLARLEESKRLMIEDSDRYAEDHKNDYIEDKTAIDEFMSGDDKKSNDKKVDSKKSTQDKSGDKKSKKGKKN